MRPRLLDPLFASLTSLPGIGPKLAKLFARLFEREAPRVADLLFHLPTGTIDRRARPKLRDVVPGSIVTVAVTVDHHRPPPPRRPRAPYQVYASDDTADIVLTFFNPRHDLLERLLPVGELRYVSGTADFYDGMLQMVHPDRIVTEADLFKLPLIEPVYPLTEGLSLNVVRKAAEAALGRVPLLPEWQDAAWLRQRDWPDFRAALRALHHPSDPAAVAPETPAWSRLAYDELLAGQLALALVRASQKRLAGRPSRGDGRLRRRIVAALPYALTASQARAIAEIEADLGKDERMLRLLQGDVGSGKTVVALLAMAAAIEAGAQAALMAPTELLAHQHMATLERFAAPAGLRLARLTGRDKGKHRDALLAALAAGEVDILVGTHALFQEDVAFKDLALAVIDEQHRFGVHQRMELAGKGKAADMLVMTA
ncbi:MAG TPA: DEAD/DEAH box helicase, partial [Xanthobacteraceae bacterium]|nr:DEAD/DEAH box helicase [Xanthobacteraceae bacterium]